MNIIALICARGGSKGILNKNIKIFDGEPLIVRSINQAKKLKEINRVIVSTDSKEIANIDKIMSKFLKRNSKINIFLDLSEIDKKYYHSGLRFTFFSKNIRGEIAQGGRYLVSKDDKNIYFE